MGPGWVGGFVQHLIAPHSLAAPMHLHHDEDEYTYVQSGRVGAISNGAGLFAEAGDLLVKPRGEWHTFFNADDGPASVREIVSPGGVEELFRSFGSQAEPLTSDKLAERAAAYQCEVDFEATMPLLERYGLRFYPITTRGRAGDRTPEELETLLDDAIVLGDIEGLLTLFAPRAVLAGFVTAPAHDSTDIERSVRALISADWAYVAEPALVLQADRTALVVAPRALNVARRERDGLCRYQICRVSPSQAIPA